MSHAPTTAAVFLRPDPPRPMPARIAQVFGLLRTLIAYGRNLAETLQQHANDPEALSFFAFIASIFNTSNVSLILAHITRRLRRAVALEARLLRRAARGQDLGPNAIRPPSACKPRLRQTGHQAAPTGRDPSFVRLPTPKEIAAEVRHRPLAAVLVDICLDLGIVPERWIATRGKN